MSVFRVVEPFAFTDRSGVLRVFTPGHLVASDDPCIRGRESLFEPVEATAARQSADSIGPVVEQATAGPGEKRSLGRKASKADAGDGAD